MALVLRLCCCTFEVRMREVGLLHSTVEAKTVQQTGRGSSPFFEHWLLICWGSSVFASCSCHSLTKTGNNKRSCRKRDNIDLEVLVIQSCPFWGHLCCSDTWTSRFPAPRPRFQRWTFLSILGNFGSWLAWMAGFQMPHRAFPLRLHPWYHARGLQFAACHDTMRYRLPGTGQEDLQQARYSAILCHSVGLTNQINWIQLTCLNIDIWCNFCEHLKSFEACIVPSIGCSSPWQARLQDAELQERMSRCVCFAWFILVHIGSYLFEIIWFILISFYSNFAFILHRVMSCLLMLHESMSPWYLWPGIGLWQKSASARRSHFLWDSDEMTKFCKVNRSLVLDIPLTAGTGCGIRTNRRDRRDQHLALCDFQLQPQVRPSLQGRNLRLRRRCGVTVEHHMVFDDSRGVTCCPSHLWR